MLIHNANVTGSMHLNGMDMSTLTGSVSSTTFNQYTSSTNEFTGSANTRITNLDSASGSLSTRVTSLESFSASLDATFATDAQLTSLSGSVSERLAGDESTITSNSSSFASRLTTDESNISGLQTASGSFSTRVTSNESNISSLQTASGSVSTRVTTIESKYATTGSNTFTGTQNITNTTNASGFTSEAALYTDGGLRVAKDTYVSGTIYVNNLTVYGSASVEYVTSSVLVGLEYIDLNTDAPALRYAGIRVTDSGSVATYVTSSLLWDSENNKWIYTNPAGSGYSGGMLISGPRASALGEEQGTTSNALMKGQGGDHITSSLITDTGTALRVPYTVEVTGSVTVNGVNTVLESRTLSINGTTYDLSANRSWEITAGISAVSAGTGISTSTLNGVATVTNTGLLSGAAGTGISVSTLNQQLTISNTGLLSGAAGTGISVSTSNQQLTITNTGLLGTTAGTGISISTTNQNSTITNTGLLSGAAGTGISVSTLNQQLTITNTGVTSNVAGTGISVSGATGAVTITNSGVTSLTAGSGISISASTGGITVTNTITNNNQLTNGAGYITSSGNAATATNATAAANISLTGVASVNVSNGQSAVYRTESGTGAALAYAPVLHLGGGDTMWQAQGTYGTSGNGTLYFRQGYNGSWGNWLTMLSSANYNSYSPTLTGTGASGTWSINVTGTAGSLSSMNISQFTNNSGYITGINSTMVTNALGYTPYNSSNPSGYITSSALSSYVPYGNWSQSTGMNDSKLYLRTNGDNNHYLWNASDDWEELNAYEGTGFRIMSVGGTVGVLYVYGSSNGGYTYSPYSFRSPIFYDSNNTGYYFDGASGTNLQYLNVNGTWGSSPFGTTHAQLTITGTFASMYHTATNGSLGYWLHHIAGDGTYNLYGGRGTVNGSDWDWSIRAYPNQDGSRVEVRTDLRAPIFYDYNDTGYYLNPAGSSVLNGTVVIKGNDNQLAIDGTVSSLAAGLFFRESGTNKYELYHYSGEFRFYNYTTNQQEMSINNASGFVTARTSFRAPIFYDSNDTGYYVDPASNSSLNTLQMAGSISTPAGTAIYIGSQNVSTSSRLIINWHTDSDYNYLIGKRAGGWTQPMDVSFYTGIKYHAHQTYGGHKFYVTGYDGTEAFSIGAGDNNVRVGYNLYTPIMYDSDNTGYYANPASTSVFNVLQFGTSTNSGRFDGESTWGVRFRTDGGYIWFGPANSGHAHIYTDRSNFYFNAPLTVNDGSYINTDDIRSAIFYDKNNTGYYGDFASLSRINEIGANKMRADTNGDYSTNQGWWSHDPYGYGWGKPHGSFRTLEVSTSGNFSTEPAMFRIHQWGSGAAEFWKPQGTILYLRETPGGSSTWFTRFEVQGRLTVTGISETSTDMRAPIFYDSQDTGYYVNPNGTSNIVTLYANDWIYQNSSGGLYWSPYSRGLASPENNGNSYGTVTTVGSGRSGWSGWGIGSRHVFMSTTGDNVGVHDNSRGWIWYWNGSFTSFDFGYTQFAGSARSPIFYDNNDTGYYVDPNSTSRMNRTNYDYVYSYNWIYAQGDIVAYYSDERLKTKTGNIENALDKIKQLNGFYYVNNDLAKSFGYKEEKTQVGLSAQEVQSVLPEVVTLAPFDTEFDEDNQAVGSKSGENYLTVNYDKLVPLLIEAIKEQQHQIEELKTIINGFTK